MAVPPNHPSHFRKKHLNANTLSSDMAYSIWKTCNKKNMYWGQSLVLTKHWDPMTWPDHGACHKWCYPQFPDGFCWKILQGGAPYLDRSTNFLWFINQLTSWGHNFVCQNGWLLATHMNLHGWLRQGSEGDAPHRRFEECESSGISPRISWTSGDWTLDLLGISGISWI